VEIAGLAEVTVLVLVPEGGDDIQAMKSGIMEIADVFVVNKSDREGAGIMAASLEKLAASRDDRPHRPVLQTSAIDQRGVEALAKLIVNLAGSGGEGANEKHVWLLAEKLFRLIRKNRMKDVDKQALAECVRERLSKGSVNLYTMAEEF
jgi:LAO/AO transport system kinase